MAAALHIAPGGLLDADDEVLDELIEIGQRERAVALWRVEVEALSAELLHALWRVTLQVNAKRGSRIPSPLRLPRPWDPAPSGPPRVSLRQLATILGPGG